MAKRDGFCIKIRIFEGPGGGCAVSDSLVLENRSSSAESARANTEANVRGHCLFRLQWQECVMAKERCNLRFTLVSEPKFVHGISTR